jgi:glycosyltransferase involved in cell wall biosynthesis
MTTTKTPKISILMAVYNENIAHLEKSIKSILNQTFTDFEFIIINDCSNTSVTSALKDYARNDNRIVLVKNKKNIGLTKSLNIGIKKARGKYIARMDSDDISLPYRLEKQLAFLSIKNYDLIVSNYELINDTGDFLTQKKISIPSNIKKYMLKGNSFIHSTFFGKKTVFEELYNEKFKRAQDYEFLLRNIGKGYKIGNLPKVCLQYRLNNMSISFKNSKEQEWSALQARLLSITKYGYPKLYFPYLLRSFFVFLLPHKLKLFLLK